MDRSLKLATLAFDACLLLAATPAMAQFVSSCTAMAAKPTGISGRLGKEVTITNSAKRIDRAKAVKPTPAAIVWRDCAKEGETCRVEGYARVRYGAGEQWAEKPVSRAILCGNSDFGDPAFNVVKTCQTTGLLAQAGSTRAPTPMAKVMPTSVMSGPIPREKLGVNVNVPLYYSGEPLFANLLTGSRWRSADWSDAPTGTMDETGAIHVGAGERFYRLITPPTSVLSGKSTTVVCTWEGSGSASVQGERGGSMPIRHGERFDWPGSKGGAGNVWLEVRSSKPSDPLRDFDCREKDVARRQVFSADAVEELKPFGVLRFMDWSDVNGNGQFTWATRTLPDSIEQTSTGKGIALEHMVSLAKEVDADGWYNVPWNADDDYVLRMAQLVHDGTPTTRHVYVEVSNEIWNLQFPQTQQAMSEGLAKGLSTDKYEARLLRLAEKTRQVMPIWSEVFADRPGQLVRVVSTQAWAPDTAETVLGKGKGADVIDALAIAPYFAHDTFEKLPNTTDLDVLMPAIADSAKQVIADPTLKNAAIARKYRVRLISYEAGQHLIHYTNADVLRTTNRSPAMGQIYSDYLTGWYAATGDLNTLFYSAGPITVFGAWGLREYSGQQRSEAPKLNATLRALGR